MGLIERFHHKCFGDDDWFNCWLLSQMEVREIHPTLRGFLEWLRVETEPKYVRKEIREEVLGDFQRNRQFLETNDGKSFQRQWPILLVNNFLVHEADLWEDNWSPRAVEYNIRLIERKNFIPAIEMPGSY